MLLSPCPYPPHRLTSPRPPAFSPDHPRRSARSLHRRLLLRSQVEKGSLRCPILPPPGHHVGPVEQGAQRPALCELQRETSLADTDSVPAVLWSWLVVDGLGPSHTHIVNGGRMDRAGRARQSVCRGRPRSCDRPNAAGAGHEREGSTDAGHAQGESRGDSREARCPVSSERARGSGPACIQRDDEMPPSPTEFLAAVAAHRNATREKRRVRKRERGTIEMDEGRLSGTSHIAGVGRPSSGR